MQAPTLPPVATLWIGDALSWLEQLCLISFVRAGHEVRFYSYAPVAHVPDGVRQLPAADILPATDFLRHERTGSPAIHADLFRLHLMQKTDCIWIDADVLCWRPFADLGEYVFGLETPKMVCNAVLRLPPHSKALAGIIDFLSDPHPIPPWAPAQDRAEMEAAKAAGTPVPISKQRWGTSGPGALSHFLKEHGEFAHAMPVEAFYPVSFPDRRQLVLTRHAPDAAFVDEVYAVHLWGRRIKRWLLGEPEGLPRRRSFLARMIREYEIDPAAAPITDDRAPAPEDA